MNLPLLTRYIDILRYDRTHDVIMALDWRAYPAQRALVEHTTAEMVAQAIGVGAIGDGPATAYMAGYGLALAAHTWADRPSEARRAGLIQASEWLRRARPFDRRLARVVEQGLALADAAIMSGGDAKAALLEFVDGQINRADRLAERCGRIAADLLDQHDQVLTHGFAGPALNWMLAIAHGEQGKQIELTITTPTGQPNAAQLASDLATELGVAATQLPAAALEHAFVKRSYNLMIVGADWIAMDGGVAGASGAAAYIGLARGQAIPRYVIGYEGPDPSFRTTGDLSAALAEQVPHGASVVPPDHVSAIITSRGIYRPEMIARYLGDRDAPPDLIPLLQ